MKKFILFLLLSFTFIHGFFYQATILKRGAQRIILFSDAHCAGFNGHYVEFKHLDKIQRAAMTDLFQTISDESVVIVEDRMSYNGNDEELQNLISALKEDELMSPGVLSYHVDECKKIRTNFPIINVDHRIAQFFLSLVDDGYFDNLPNVSDIENLYVKSQIRHKALQKSTKAYSLLRARLKEILITEFASKDAAYLADYCKKMMQTDSLSYMESFEKLPTSIYTHTSIFAAECDSEALEMSVLDNIIHNQNRKKIFVFLGGDHIKNILPTLIKMKYRLLYQYGNKSHIASMRKDTLDDAQRLDELIDAPLDRIQQVAYPNLTIVPNEFFELCKKSKLTARLFRSIQKTRSVANSNVANSNSDQI